MERKTIARGVGYEVYIMDGRYYIDLFKKDRPIHSYETIEGVKEALYYGGYINSKTEEI